MLIEPLLQNKITSHQFLQASLTTKQNNWFAFRGKVVGSKALVKCYKVDLQTPIVFQSKNNDTIILPLQSNLQNRS